MTFISHESFDSAARTKALSPSKLSIALECPLRYVFETERPSDAPLPESVASCLGTAVHAAIGALTREAVQYEVGAVRATVSAEFVRLVMSQKTAPLVLEALGVSADPANLLPASVLLDRLRVAMHALESLRALRRRKPAAIADANKEFVSCDAAQGDNRQYGVEIPLSSRSLDLSGRADLIERRSSEHVRITEFKTGIVLTHGETPTHAVLIQVCAYALLQTERLPRAAIAVRVVAPNGEWERPFTHELAAETLATLQAILEQLPRDVRLHAANLASPGRVCCSCRFRPMCSSYRRWAETHWNTGNGSLPFDTWGDLERIDPTSPRLSSIRLRDAAGRRVRIANVPTKMLSDARAGNWLEAFGIVPTEVGRGKAFPCNFQIADGRRSYRSAFSALLDMRSHSALRLAAIPNDSTGAP